MRRRVWSTPRGSDVGGPEAFSMTITALASLRRYGHGGTDGMAVYHRH